MKKFFIKTHGCKANQLESNIIREKLLNANYTETTNSSDADIFILNSCSVTETADIEALRTLRNIKHKNPDVLTIFTGCSAQLNFQKTNQNEYIDQVHEHPHLSVLNHKQSLFFLIVHLTPFQVHFVRPYHF